jgi:hypothetical protein
MLALELLGVSRLFCYCADPTDDHDLCRETPVERAQQEVAHRDPTGIRNASACWKSWGVPGLGARCTALTKSFMRTCIPATGTRSELVLENSRSCNLRLRVATAAFLLARAETAWISIALIYWFRGWSAIGSSGGGYRRVSPPVNRRTVRERGYWAVEPVAASSSASARKERSRTRTTGTVGALLRA